MVSKHGPSKFVNSISVDVEEYFHANNLGTVAPPQNWYRLPKRVEGATHQVLELLSDCKTRATFFVLGYVARRYPQLIKAIAQQGHEIASHGYAHQLIYEHTEKYFFRDIYRTKRLLEDLSGTSVIGYRAPSFSITKHTPWAYPTLLRAGYRYDSSAYPIRHPRYGNRDLPMDAFTTCLPEGCLYVLPLAVYEAHLGPLSLRVPIAGGAYWRFLPRGLIEFALRKLERESAQPFHCYFHPWELDSGQPKFDELSFLTKLRHYGGIPEMADRVKQFLQTFRFGPFLEVVPQIYPNFPKSS